MQYITTTELRTQTSKLVKTLKSKGRVSLIHRSEVIGVIQPAEEPKKPFDPSEFRQLLKGFKPERLIPREDREKVYRARLEQKYGKNLPGR